MWISTSLLGIPARLLGHLSEGAISAWYDLHNGIRIVGLRNIHVDVIMILNIAFKQRPPPFTAKSSTRPKRWYVSSGYTKGLSISPHDHPQRVLKTQEHTITLPNTRARFDMNPFALNFESSYETGLELQARVLLRSCLDKINSWHAVQSYNQYFWWFIAVFLLRYIRVLANIFGTLRYRAIPMPLSPTYSASDVTVVIATTDIMLATFHHVVQSILEHPVHRMIIATAGVKAQKQEEIFQALHSDPRILILHREHANRREQTAQAMAHVETSLLILQDDHTYWPTRSSFLQSVIAPFEDPSTGGVSPVIEARHRQHPISFVGFWNFLGMTYLARRQFDYCATYGIDGGMSTLPGRFGVFRTGIYASKDFLQEYLNEYIFWGLVGPLNADDDKFHTRWLINHGWKIKLQAGPESTLMTELGEWPKFREQCLRWMRTTWRSNPRQLLTNHKSWVHHPYTSFTLFLWFFRLSLIHEASMFYFLHATLKEADMSHYYKALASTLVVWIVTLKYIKVSAHFRKHPHDILYFPAYLLFGYWCTLVKIWAMLTCWNASWATVKVSDKLDDDQDADPLMAEVQEGSAPARGLKPSEDLNSHMLSQLSHATELLRRNVKRK